MNPPAKEPQHSQEHRVSGESLEHRVADVETKVDIQDNRLFGDAKFEGDSGVIGELLRRTGMVQKLLIGVVILLGTTSVGLIVNLLILLARKGP